MEEPFVPFARDKENDAFWKVGTSFPSPWGNADFCLNAKVDFFGNVKWIITAFILLKLQDILLLSWITVLNP